MLAKTTKMQTVMLTQFQTLHTTLRQKTLVQIHILPTPVSTGLHTMKQLLTPFMPVTPLLMKKAITGQVQSNPVPLNTMLTGITLQVTLQD